MNMQIERVAWCHRLTDLPSIFWHKFFEKLNIMPPNLIVCFSYQVYIGVNIILQLFRARNWGEVFTFSWAESMKLTVISLIYKVGNAFQIAGAMTSETRSICTIATGQELFLENLLKFQNFITSLFFNRNFHQVFTVLFRKFYSFF